MIRNQVAIGVAKYSIVFIAVFSFFISYSQNKGPGGVGQNNGTGTLRAWWRGDAGVTITSGAVSGWADQSGYGNNLSQTTAARRPTSATASSTVLNGQSVIRYTGSSAQYFNSSINGPNVDNFTLFLVANGSSYQSLFRYQNTSGTFVVYPWELGTGKQFLVSTDGNTNGIQAGLVDNANNVGGARYRRNTTNGFQAFLNGGVNAERTSVDVAVPSQPFYSGVYNPGPGEYPTANVGEMIVYYSALSDAQMVIVQNYLAAKYDVTLTSNDVYRMDDAANGNYDFDVAGIGRVGGVSHSDAQGTGIIRVAAPTGLDDGEYLMWGRDNGATTLSNTTDIPSNITARLARTWRVSEVGEVGNVSFDVDLTGITGFTSLSTVELVSRLRFLVDTNNNGLFSDETPIFGASIGGTNIYRFSNVSAFNNNVRFTFGLGQARTFYSLGSGAWEDNTKWSLSSDGSTGPLPAGQYPTRIDNVVINAGHTITVDNITDNGSPGVRPDDLGQANIGGFGGSNLSMFYQTGNIIILGTLNIAGIEAMIGGYTWVQNGGSLKGQSSIVVTGNLQADTGSTLSTLDDLILTGNSTTIINTASTSSDDLIIDHTDATLCGTGTTTLQNGAGSIITYANGGTVNQVCTVFTINCTGTGCTGFPVVGTTVVIVGNTGPAGVGSSSGDSQLKLWFRSDNGVNRASTTINSWTNSAGIAALDISESGSQRPTYVANAVNGFPEIRFDGTNRLRTGLTLTSSNFINNQATSFTVNRADNITQTSCVYETDPLDGNRFSNHIPWAGTVYFDIGTCCNTDARLDVPSLTNLTNYSIWSYEAESSSGKTMYRNGTSLLNRAGISTFTNHANYRFNIGGNTSGSSGYAGNVTEVVIYNNKVNSAERILIENYLSAKYNIGLSANDVYTLDNGPNNFDFDVAGIARTSDGYHKDAQGTGILRIWAPSNLDVNEYLIWGHNGATLTTTTTAVGTAVDGTIIKERLTRIWAVNESAGDVGNHNLAFETSQFTGSFVGSNLRLLIDRNNNGFQDNDVAPMLGSFSNGKLIFSNVNLQNGDRFTLGNTSSTQALPITLLSFNAAAREYDVLLEWKTASEIGNDHFEIERSMDAEKWEFIGNLKGAGTSRVQNNYTFIDDRPVKGRSYYRLKQVDTDNEYSYSRIVPVDFDRNVVTIWPNPSNGVFNISTSDVYVEVFNIQGKKIISSRMESSQTGIDISEQPAGVYILKVYDDDGIRVFRLVKK